MTIAPTDLALVLMAARRGGIGSLPAADMVAVAQAIQRLEAALADPAPAADLLSNPKENI